MENKKQPENPQAFPQTWESNGQVTNWENGMYLRDYFAAKAMQGLCTATNAAGDWTMPDNKNLAQEAYSIADAMLTQRQTPQE